jgi:transketolase
MKFSLRSAAPRATHGRPAIIIAHTIKGKGVPYMENIPHWHGSVKLTRAQAEEALDARSAQAAAKSRNCSMSRPLKRPP